MFYEMNTNIMYEPTRKCSWSGKWLFSNKHEWNNFCCDYSDFFSEISIMLATQLMTRARGLPVDPWAWATRPPLAFRVRTPADWSLVPPTLGLFWWLDRVQKSVIMQTRLSKSNNKPAVKTGLGDKRNQTEENREREKNIIVWCCMVCLSLACQSKTVTSE